MPAETVLDRLAVQLTVDLKGLMSGLRKATKAIRRFSRGVKRGLAPFVNAFKSLGRVVVRIANRIRRAMKWAMLGIAASTAFAVKAYVDFQAALADVSTMLDDHTQRLLPEYAEGLQHLAVLYGESTETLAKGLYNILSATVAADKGLEVLNVSARAAAAGLTQTSTTAFAITGILNAYGMSADKAAAVSDILFAAVKRGQTTFAQLAPLIGRVTAISATAGVRFEEVAAALATITRGGISTDEAVTSLRMALIQLQGQTEDAIGLAAKYGIELSTEALQREGLIGQIKKLALLQPSVLKDMFREIRARIAINVLIKDQEGFQTDLNLTMKAGGLTQKAFDIQTKTLGFSLKRLWQSVIALAVSLGEKLAPSIKKAADQLRKWLVDNRKEMADFFGNMIAGAQSFILYLRNDWIAGLTVAFNMAKALTRSFGQVIIATFEWAAESAVNIFITTFSKRFDVWYSDLFMKITGIGRLAKGAGFGPEFILWKPGTGPDAKEEGEGRVEIPTLKSRLDPIISDLQIRLKELTQPVADAATMLKWKMWVFDVFTTVKGAVESFIRNTPVLQVMFGLAPPKPLAAGLGDYLDQIGDMAAWEARMDAWKAIMEDAFKSAAATFRWAFQTAFSDAMLGAKSFKDAMIGFLKDIARAIMDNIGGSIADALTGTQGSPGIVGRIINVGLGLFNPKPTKLAVGGIVTRPTLAMLGEGRSPEAVIPLDQMDRLGGVTININSPWDGESVMRAIKSQAVAAVLRDYGMNGPIRSMIRGTR